MCGATKGGLSLDGVDINKEAVIQGQVLKGDVPVGNALPDPAHGSAGVPQFRWAQWKYVRAADSTP